MTDHPLVHGQTPTEYFKELVESPLSRQRVRAGDLTEFYLVNLLCQYVGSTRLPTRTTMDNRWRCAGRRPSTAAASNSECDFAASVTSPSSCPGSSRTA